MKTIILLLSLISTLSWAIPEKELPEAWHTKALPHFYEMKKGSIKNSEGMTLKYFMSIHVDNERSLVLVPGRGEPAIKYAELIYDLKDEGFNIFILDHQGQGESDRILSDTNKGHVIDFKNYVKDLEHFMNEIVHSNTRSTPVYLMAFSMGGAVSAHYMALHPQVFKKAILMSPMFEMNTDPYSEAVARYYSKLLVSTGKGSNYAPDRGPYRPELEQFETNHYTHSEARFDITKFLFTNWTHLSVGGPTTQWVHEALKATKDIDELKFETPVLMYQAGLDKLVKPGRQNSFCRLKGNCELKELPESFHEIWMETDLFRDEMMKDIRSFFGV